MSRKYIFTIILLALVVVGGTVAYANYVVNPTPTGYYLPKGYKVDAKVYVPDAPLWGNTIGEAVGLSCDKYSVIVFGWGEKTWNWEAKHGIKVIWRQGGADEDKAYVDLEPNKKHDVTIVYDWDGTVKISVDGKFIYSFVATEQKYTIVAQGATVSEPEALPEPTTTPPTGSGYNHPSTQELQTQYLLLGAGAAIIVTAVMLMFAKGRKMKGKTSTALLIIIMLVMGMAGAAIYYVYRATQVSEILPLPLTEEIGDKPVLVALQFGTIKPGMVFQVTPGKQGWQIKQKDTHLYEKLVLSNIDLAVNDAVAWHGYDWWFDGADDYLSINYINLTMSYVNITLGWYAESQDHVAHVISPYIMPLFKLYSGSSQVGKAGIYIPAYYGITQGFTFWTRNATDYNWQLTVQFSTGFHRYSFVFDGQTLSIYEDGQELGSTTRPDVISFDTVGIGGNIFIQRFKGTISYLMISDQNNYKFILDPTFFNGTHYIDIVSGTVGTPYGGVARITSEHPWLWLVKNLASDNKLHFKWFPEGTIIRIKDSSGNVIREFTITGDKAGNTTQVLDYAISLDITTLLGATVEALVPSMKVRVYAPASSYVAILGDDGTKYGEYVVGYNGYVDIPLTSPLTNAYIVVYADEEKDSGLNIHVKDLGGGKLEVKVYNDKGVLIPGLLVRLVDPANVVLDYAITDESGTAELNAGRPLAEAKILVDGVWDGTIYKMSKTVTLAESMSTGVETSPSPSAAEQYKYLLIGLFVLILIALIVALAKRR